MDTISKNRRSWNMSRIRSENTRPELRVRAVLRKAGYKFRTYSNTLPGRPDFVLYKNKAVIFIHGCFWHHHNGCSRANWPKSNKTYWIPKIKATIVRDKTNAKLLKIMKWRVIILWECRTKDENEVLRRLRNIL